MQPNETDSNQLNLIKAQGIGGKGRPKEQQANTQPKKAIPGPFIVEGPMKLL